MNIYDKRGKSYDADLMIGETKLHVKSHISNGSYPPSWVFQKNDPLINNPDRNDYLALCVNLNGVDYMHLKNISEVMFQPPIKDSLKNTKLCIYESYL